MASVSRSGHHTSHGVKLLIAEKILPPEPSKDLYSWQVYVDAEGLYGSEELVVTDHAIVWTQGEINRRLLRFEKTDTKIQQTLLTWFHGPENPQNFSKLQNDLNGNSRRKSLAVGSASIDKPTKRRALVAILKQQLHIHFLQGAGHVVNLPFEVENAFALPFGLLIQRRLSLLELAPSTPFQPSAPPNSFWSSQNRTWPSPTSNRKLSRHSGRNFGPKNVKLPVSIADFKIGQESSNFEPLPRLFALTDPVSELNVISNLGPRPYIGALQEDSILTTNQDELMSDLEQVVYASTTNEIPSSNELSKLPLLLVITFNLSTRNLTIWHASYSEPPKINTNRKLDESIGQRRKSKRPSTFRQRRSTGANTPALRQGDGLLQDHSANFQGTKSTSTQQNPQNRPSDSMMLNETLEDDLQTQIENDYGFAHSSGSFNRRTSSRIARAELSSQDQQFFPDMNRTSQILTTSFGTQNRRKQTSAKSMGRSSFGHSRYSGRDSLATSIGRLSDVDEVMQEEVSYDDRVDEIVLSQLRLLDSDTCRHQDVVDSCQKEVALIRIATVSSSDLPMSGSIDKLKVIVSCSKSIPGLITKARPNLSLLLHDTRSRTVVKVSLNIRMLYPRRETPSKPLVETVEPDGVLLPCNDDITVDPLALTEVLDMTLIRDGKASGIAFLHQEENHTNSLSILSPNMQRPTKIHSFGQDGFSSGSGSDHLTDISFHQLSTIRQADYKGNLDILGDLIDPLRVQVHLRPRNVFVDHLLDLLGLLFPGQSPCGSQAILTWRMFQSRFSLDDHGAILMTLVATVTTALRPESLISLSSKECHDDNQKRSKEESHKNWMRLPAWKWSDARDEKNSISQKDERNRRSSQMPRINVLPMNLTEVVEYLEAPAAQEDKWLQSWRLTEDPRSMLSHMIFGIHLFEEEQMLNQLMNKRPHSDDLRLARMILKIVQDFLPAFDLYLPSIIDWVNQKIRNDQIDVFPSLSSFSCSEDEQRNMLHGLAKPDLLEKSLASLTPRTEIVRRLFDRHRVLGQDENKTYRASIDDLLDMSIIETFIPTLQREVITIHRGGEEIRQSDVDRDQTRTIEIERTESASSLVHRDVRLICSEISYAALSRHGNDRHMDLKEKQSDRRTAARINSVEPLIDQIFRDNRRWYEAEKILDPLKVAVAESTPQPLMTEAMFLEGQKVLAQKVYQRTMALPAGQGALMFGTYSPMVTEKIHISGFNTGCVMQPSGNVVSAEKSHFTEEKVSWAFFHAGVNAGLRLSRTSTTIDNSWIVLNKPNELGNRHAGLLLALGLNGHLKHMAKWLAFKYLTPKHNMTSVGLLLGMSASHLGTMDSLVTRLLSVHVTRLLPPGAAELNLSPLTQTAGILGVGLLYYNSRHRRMSEILLSEIEHVQAEDSISLQDTYQDEGYRLAAGFALGLINLGRGREAQVLSDLKATERLVTAATAPKEVDTVHILDQASSGATIAICLIYLKSNNSSVASKIAIPSSPRQFSYIRPDVLLLRTVARNLIMWDSIGKDFNWIRSNLPSQFLGSARMDVKSAFRVAMLPDAPSAGSLAYYNILAGLCWSIALKHAGTADLVAWDTLKFYFDHIRPVINTQYATFDKSLARDTLMRFQHLLALGMSTIMAGTGHLQTLQRLRTLHGIVEDKTFGYHQATHMAIGVLFLGQGRYTFGTGDLAIASLLCAFYPIFPKDALDNRAHLQAFRHFWVFAAEPRCLVLRDAETKESVMTPVYLRMRDGSETSIDSPALLPELEKIFILKINAVGFRPVEINFSDDPRQLKAFRKCQTVTLRKESLLEQHPSTLASTFDSLNQKLAGDETKPFDHLSKPPFSKIYSVNEGDAEEILPNISFDRASSLMRRNPLLTLINLRTTAVDEALEVCASLENQDLKVAKGIVALIEQSRRMEHLREGSDNTTWIKEEWADMMRAKSA